MNNANLQYASDFLKFIAYLQVMGIVLVVLGHSFHEYPDGDAGKTLLIYRMFHSFRMPLFLFTSGFLMVYTTRRRKAPHSVVSFAKSKIKRLLLPFAVLTLVTFLPRVLMSGIADDALDMSMHSFWQAFFYTDKLVIPYLWFLQASFLLLVFCYATIRLAEKAGISDRVTYPALVILFFALPLSPIEFTSFFSLREAAGLGFFFAAGAAYCRFSSTIDKHIPWHSPFMFVAALVIWCMLFFATENTPFWAICSFAGIAMCISLAKILEKRGITLLDHLIGANYLIFLLSWYFNVASQQVLHNIIDMPWWCFTALSLITGVYIPLLCFRLLRRNSHRSWAQAIALLLGQNIGSSQLAAA